MKFSEFNLDARLQAGIKRAGYQTPTPIQQQAIPEALNGSDLVGTAQTGTGKTAAFVLPILNKLLKGPRGKTRALIVTPTRELAEQIHETVLTLAAGTGLRSATVYGGVGANPQIKALRMGTEIIVACPGRLLDLANQRIANMSHVDVLVLDEADRMFDMGFLPDVKRIIKLLPAQRQNMLFSATFPSEVGELAKLTLKNPKRVSVGISRPAHTVSHALYPVSQIAKSALLLELLKRTGDGSVLVFTRTKHRAQKVSRQLEHGGYQVTSLHGNRSQSQRQTALKGFRQGRFQIMVATDIAARGIDVEGISHVINYDMPDTTDAYIHRIGRTGRAERTGDAFTLVAPEDEPMVRSLEKIMGSKIERRKVEGFNYSQSPMTPVPGAVNPPAQKPSRHQPRPSKHQAAPSKQPAAPSKHQLRKRNANRRSGLAKRLTSYR